MIKFSGRTLKNRIQANTMDEADRLSPIIEARINGGIISSIDPADIPNNALSDAKNVFCRFDKTGPVEGVVIMSPTKPNSNKVLKLYSYKQNNGTSYTLRFTNSTIHKLSSSSWQILAGTLTGSAMDRFSVATAFNQVIFANSIDPIKQIDLLVGSYTNLGNAPRYKYVTSFYNRVVGAYYNEPGSVNPVQVGWSADGVITEWDPLVNQSAGNSSIIESPGDYADFAAGVFGFTNVLLLIREKSVWVATKNPVASNPFEFRGVIPGKGCTAPNSISVVPGGLIWVDPRTKNVYAYSIGGELQPISDNIRTELFKSITDLDSVEGSYNTLKNEYSILIPSLSDYKRIWTFNLDNSSWVYAELPNVSCINDVDTIAQELLIDDLTGTIDDLTGIIDDLTGTLTVGTQRLYGKEDGDIYHAQDSALNTFESSVISKEFNFPVATLGVQKVKIDFKIITESTINLYFTKNSGITWTLGKTITFSPSNESQVLYFQRYIRARKFMFKLVSTNCKWEVLNYEILAIPSGKVVRNY